MPAGNIGFGVIGAGRVMHRCTLVRADEFQFGFLLLTSTLYFQLGSGSGLDVIKYPTCSNTCPLPASNMSTTFNIIPTKVDNSLTFQNVLTLAKQTLGNQLDKLSINLPVDFLVNIRHDKEEYVNSINLDTKFIWKENEYAWFKVDKSNGGTDAYCQRISEHLSDWDTYIEDTLENIAMTPQLKQQIIDCEYEWYFRRSAGQSPLMTITYGHLAAAVAKLTDGYIYTYDGAWHDNIFPATAEQLLEVYFYPDKAKDATDFEWVTKCIEGLKSDFASR